MSLRPWTPAQHAAEAHTLAQAADARLGWRRAYLFGLLALVHAVLATVPPTTPTTPGDDHR